MQTPFVNRIQQEYCITIYKSCQPIKVGKRVNCGGRFVGTKEFVIEFSCYSSKNFIFLLTFIIKQTIIKVKLKIALKTWKIGIFYEKRRSALEKSSAQRQN